MTDLTRAINSLYTSQAFSIVNNDYDTLVWHESNSEEKPALSELELAAELFSIEDAKKSKLAQLTAVKDEELYANVEYKGKVYRNSEKSLLNLTGNYSILEDGEESPWLTVAGEPVSLSKEDFKQLMLKCKAIRSAAYFKEATKTQEILSLTLDESDETKDTVEKVVALINAIEL